MLLSTAETSAGGIFSGFDWASSAAIPIGATVNVTIPGARGYLTRLDRTTFWIVTIAADSSVIGYAAERRVGMAVEVTTDSTGKVHPTRMRGRGWAELF